MSEVLAILAVVAMVVVFGLLQRKRGGGCPGEEACDTVDDPGGCAGCSYTSESKHART